MHDLNARLEALSAQVASLRTEVGVVARLEALEVKIDNLHARLDEAFSAAGLRPNGTAYDVAAWTVKEWSSATRTCVAKVQQLISAGRINSVKNGRSRLILTSPPDYFRSLEKNPPS